MRPFLLCQPASLPLCLVKFAGIDCLYTYYTYYPLRGRETSVTFKTRFFYPLTYNTPVFRR